VIEVHRNAGRLKGLRITHGAPFLRHFTAALEELPQGVPAVPAAR